MSVGQMFGRISGEADVRGGTVTVRARRIGNDGPDFVAYEVSGPSLSGLVAVYPLPGGLPDVGEVERVIVVTSGYATCGPFATEREDRLKVQGAPVEVVMVFRADGTEVDTARLAVISPRFPDQRVLAFLDPAHAYAREVITALVRGGQLGSRSHDIPPKLPQGSTPPPGVSPALFERQVVSDAGLVTVEADIIDDYDTGFMACDASGESASGIRVSGCVEFYPLQLAHDTEARYVLVASGTSATGPYGDDRCAPLLTTSEAIEAVLIFVLDGSGVDPEVRQRYERPQGDLKAIAEERPAYGVAFTAMATLAQEVYRRRDTYLERPASDRLLRGPIYAQDLYRKTEREPLRVVA